MQDADADLATGVHVRVEHLALEPHRRRRVRIVRREGQRGGEEPARVRRAGRTGDQRFPEEEVGFGDGPRGYAVRGGGCEELVFVEKTLGGDGGDGHFGDGEGFMFGCGARGGGLRCCCDIDLGFERRMMMMIMMMLFCIEELLKLLAFFHFHLR